MALPAVMATKPKGTSSIAVFSSVCWEIVVAYFINGDLFFVQKLD